MDLNLDTAKSLGKIAHVDYTTDLDALLGNPQIEAVVIAVPHNLHASITERAAAAGKHVIVEKPIATTLADADRMIAACQQAKVALSVLFSFRYEPHIQKARELVQAGALGTIVGTSIQFATEKPAGYWGQGYSGRALTDWRGSWEKCGGGVLIMNVCHTIDYFQFITGLEVSQAYSEFSTLNSPVEVEDIIAVTLRYHDGAIGNIQAATLARGEKMSEERIWGTHGSMTLAPLPSQIYSLRKVPGLSPGKWSSFGKLAKVNRVAAFMDDFVRDVRSGRPPAVTGERGRDNLAVVLAAYEAGRAGRAMAPGTSSLPSQEVQA
jgi:predicted dehydrogenase